MRVAPFLFLLLFNFATTQPAHCKDSIANNLPSSGLIAPHGRLEKMEREADLAFKGRVISTRAITNTAFPDWGKPHATEFRITSLLKGTLQTNVIVFLHITGRPGAWGGSGPPQQFIFEAGSSYLVFAANANRADWLYTPESNNFRGTNVFRQLMQGEIPIRTLDDRTLGNLSLKGAHWQELNLLVRNSNVTNQLYAIKKLDEMSLAGRSQDRWAHSDDFKRDDVLSALRPLLTNGNEQVANRAIVCFATESGPMPEPFAEELIKIANGAPSTKRRLNAIGSLSHTHFEAVSNSLARLLRDPDENTRSSAVGLLAFYPGTFSEQALRQSASDESPKVRAEVAKVIGNGEIENLIPTLTELFLDPAGRQKNGRLSIEDLEAGSRIADWGNGGSIYDEANFTGFTLEDVHTSAGYALMQFDLNQVGDILKTNLNDPGFRLSFLCKLAKSDPKPWVNDMVEAMEVRRARTKKKFETSGLADQPAYFTALMTLTGNYSKCWNIIYEYLNNLPAADFENGKLDRCLNMLENGGTSGSREPVLIYELYRSKGLNDRAMKYRAYSEKNFGYDISIYFKKADEKFSSPPNR